MAKHEHNESHDWLGDAAECLVRYYFAKANCTVYGSSKRGADCMVVGRDTNKSIRCVPIEIKSTDCHGWEYLKRQLKNKIKRKMKSGNHSGVNDFKIFVAVRLIREKDNDRYEPEGLSLGNVFLQAYRVAAGGRGTCQLEEIMLSDIGKNEGVINILR